jgi:hypothetical protein
MTKKQNAEEDYITTPISVLSYITDLERQLAKATIELDTTYDFYSRLVDIVPKDAVHINGLRREDLADLQIKKLNKGNKG